MIKNHLQDIALLIGAIIQITGFISYFREIAINPVYSLTILIIGYLLVTYYCLYRMLKKSITDSSMLDIKNMSIKMKYYTYSRRQRIMAILILFISTIATFSLGFTVITKTKNPIAEPPMAQVYQIANRTAYFDFIKIYAVNWIGGGAYAISGKNEYPLAYIQDTDHLEKMSRFYGTACALKFDLETRNDIGRVSIDDIIVKVSDYKPLPKYEAMLPAPFEEANVLYVEIDNPSRSKTNFFPAIKRIDHGKVKDIGIMYLEYKKPETFILRINAKRPGIYTIECQMIVRYKDQTERIYLSSPSEWLFDK